MAEEYTWDQKIDEDQSMYDEEDAYMDNPWSENEKDYGHEPEIEEPESKPPDHAQDNSRQKMWYEEEDEWEEKSYEVYDEGARQEDANLNSDIEDEQGCQEIALKPPDNTWSFTYQTPHKSEPIVAYDLDCE